MLNVELKSNSKQTILQLSSAKAPPPTDTKSLSWFSGMVERGRAAPFSEIVTITPEIAKRILAANAGNRKVSNNLVEQIASDIKGGYWELNGEAVIISKDGELNDGQHRLNAVVLAGKPVQSVVIFGVSRDSRYTVDMGRARTTSDFIGMEGAGYATLSSAIARLHLAYRQGRYNFGGANNCTKQVVRAEYWANEKKIISAIKFTECKFTGTSASATPMSVAYMATLEASKDLAGVQSFFYGVMTGENLKQGDARLALRARLIEARKERRLGYVKLELILRHWNAWRKNKPVARALPLLGEYPTVER